MKSVSFYKHYSITHCCEYSPDKTVQMLYFLQSSLQQEHLSWVLTCCQIQISIFIFWWHSISSVQNQSCKRYLKWPAITVLSQYRTRWEIRVTYHFLSCWLVPVFRGRFSISTKTGPEGTAAAEGNAFRLWKKTKDKNVLVYKKTLI